MRDTSELLIWGQGSSSDEDGAGGQGHAGHHHLSRSRGWEGETGAVSEAGRGLVQETEILLLARPVLGRSQWESPQEPEPQLPEKWDNSIFQ